MHITRLAPSPTGALHLGNARTFLINWLMARQQEWRVVLRIEDLDGPRVKAGADKQAIEDLRWLGLDWDQGPMHQSARTAAYDAALNRLLAAKAAYPCICTRSEAEAAASAPHGEDHSNVYPGTCRGRFAGVQEATQAAGRTPAIRFRAPDRVIEFVDGFKGPVSIDAGRLGDFVIAKSDGTAAYQLAVVMDDAEMNVTDVVRGDDLLESAARQLLLYEALWPAPRIPRWFHLPLVIGRDGRRLAKRHGDTRLAHYRGAGVSAGKMRAVLGRWCGIECGGEADLTELLAGFELQRVPREPIIFEQGVFDGI
jgi:glutamyl-tRNA synthetase